jgi:hypothetical protein
MTLPLAHAGHWIEAGIFALPVLAVVGWALAGARRAKREREGTRRGPEG